MSNDRTRLKARALDRRRIRRGLGTNLEILKFQPVNGYAAVTTLTEGWCGDKVEDRGLGQEFFEVSIAEVQDVDLPTLFRDKPSHLKVGQYYYKCVGVEQPRQEAVRVWLLRCNPTGQRAPIA